MSIKPLSIIVLIFISITGNMFSQNAKLDSLYVLLQLDKTVIYSISKDSTRASFGIYRKGSLKNKSTPATAIERKKSKKETLENVKNNPPMFSKRNTIAKSLEYWSIEKPIRTNTINNIPYITREEFINHELKYIYAKNLFIIHPISRGTYLIWKVDAIPVE